jgi:hypothetical protein
MGWEKLIMNDQVVQSNHWRSFLQLTIYTIQCLEQTILSWFGLDHVQFYEGSCVNFSINQHRFNVSQRGVDWSKFE